MNKLFINYIPLFISFCRIFYIISINIDIFFSYIVHKINRPFFITDSNIVAFYYFYNLTFFVYIWFMPFIIRTFIIHIRSFFNKFEYYCFIRCVFFILYTQYITLIFNHYDFLDSTINFIKLYFSFWIEGVDLIVFIIQYQGFYWDFFFIFSIIIIIVLILIEKPKLFIFCRYDKDYVVNISIIFYRLWYFRIFTYCFICYFFCGNAIMIDFIVIRFTFVSSEFFIITYRSFFLFQIVKLYMLGLFCYSED